VALPDPALVVLAGPSGSGKSAWAAERYRRDEVISSDRLRALVGSGEHDLDASADAFALLDQIAAARLRRGLTAVVDTLGLDPARRRSYLALARSSSMPAVAVLLDTDPAECRRRNRARDRPVPAPVLEGQLRRMRAAAVEIRGEGWDLVTTARQAQPQASHTPGASPPSTKHEMSGHGRGVSQAALLRDHPVATRRCRNWRPARAISVVRCAVRENGSLGDGSASAVRIG
jgi:predicted kinase